MRVGPNSIPDRGKKIPQVTWHTSPLPPKRVTPTTQLELYLVHVVMPAARSSILLSDKIDGIPPHSSLEKDLLQCNEELLSGWMKIDLLSLCLLLLSALRKRGLKSVMVCYDLGGPYHLHRPGDNLIFCFLQIQLEGKPPQPQRQFAAESNFLISICGTYHNSS